jgi:hypothetical protein
MLASVATVVDAKGIEIHRVGDVVRFTAADVRTLAVLAAPLAAWWQQHGPATTGEVVLRFVGPDGVTELTYSRPELAVDCVRHTIEVDSGRPYGPGEAPGPIRRLMAAVLRRVRTGFTASELAISDEDEVVCVALAGRDLDDRPRSVEFRAANPAHYDYDPTDDDGYCLVNEDHVPVFAGLVELRLARRSPRLRLTGEAARAWATRSTTFTVRLHLEHREIDHLRVQLRRFFSFADNRGPSPELDLG